MTGIDIITGPPRPQAQQRAVVCIGVFDGVHRGHRWLIAQARAAADRAGLPLVVMTFQPHPRSVVQPAQAPCALATLGLRVRLLAAAGADAVRIVDFNEQTASLSPQDFVEQFLAADLAAAHVVVGDNWRFGRKAQGDTDLLQELGATYDFTVEPIGLHTSRDGEVWSSSRIRNLLRSGDVQSASVGLGRLHRCEGLVVPGDQRGRLLGFPTANLDVPAGYCRPGNGVYAGKLIVDPYGAAPQNYLAAISVGINSTFGATTPRVEAHAIDHEHLQLYGKFVAVDFQQQLRPMVAFDSADQLVSAIAADVAAARAIADVPTPGQ